MVISTKDRDSSAIHPTLASIKDALRGSEIIVVDQNKEDLGIQCLIEHYQVNDTYNSYLYVKSPVVGLSAGRNLGMQYVTKNWVWFMDDDAILPNDCSTILKDFLLANQHKAIIFYGAVLELETQKPFLKRSILTNRLHFWNFDSVCSIGLIFNRSVFGKIGQFDESFGLGAIFGAGEEGDIVIRALAKGIKTHYVKGFKVYHPNAVRSSNKLSSYGFGLGSLYRKHIYSSIACLVALGGKAAMEVVLKAVLVLFFVFNDFQQARQHYHYIKGFISGFWLYGGYKAKSLPAHCQDRKRGLDYL